jgi:hypothetical protein
VTLATKADNAKQPKRHRKYPRALLVRSDDGDGRDRVGMLLVIVEGTERRARPGVPTMQVPHRQDHAGCQPERAEYRANSDGGRMGLPRVVPISTSLSITPAAPAGAGCRVTG